MKIHFIFENMISKNEVKIMNLFYITYINSKAKNVNLKQVKLIKCNNIIY